ncbi:MAG: hypothetical protein O3A19_03985 [Planctomycetota bacterium]|mgnify:CR=1 FL=1|jgi:hypothetical protein|nr:hypothetical protein [Planctomycetota bacterium]MDA1025567.1 hypothetical protein [Planctomycetota bacterium]
MKGGFSVPAWATVLGWSIAIIFLVAYFFVAHAVMRGLVPTFGWDAGAIATATFGTIAMGLGIVWLVVFAELPEIWYLHRRPHRLIRQGRCPACGHPVREAGVDRCSECGVEATWLPPPYVFGWKAARRFGLALILGFLGGLLTAETAIAMDEYGMRATVKTASNPEATDSTGDAEVQINFIRAWPASFSRVEWTPRQGFRPERLFGQGRVSNKARRPNNL